MTLRAKLYDRSNNRKLGGLPTSYTSRGTCPSTCSFKDAGCYAEEHWTRQHWNRVTEHGDTWDVFCAAVRKLPRGQLWRHNTAGDLPGNGTRIDAKRLAQLVEANRGRRGFTFSHKPMTPGNADAVRAANADGFTVNLSADSLADADRLAAFGPVVVVLPPDAPAHPKTPEGRHVVVCPAQTTDVKCAQCQLCAKPGRKSVVGFRVHGAGAGAALVQLRKKAAA